MIKFDKKTSQYIIDDDNKDLYTLQDFETTASIDALYKLALIHKTDTGNEHFNYYDREGMTPLCFCCLNQVDIRNIYYFIKYNENNNINPKPVKTDINRKSAKGKSPFQYAILSRYMEMITLLHKGEIYVPILDDEGNPKLELDKWQEPVLNSNGDPIISKKHYIIDQTVPISTNEYIAAVMMPDDKVIKALLPKPKTNEDKIDLFQHKDRQSNSTLILLACLAQVYGTIDTLLDADLEPIKNVNHKNKDGKNAFIIAIELNDIGAQEKLEPYIKSTADKYIIYDYLLQVDDKNDPLNMDNYDAGGKYVDKLYNSNTDHIIILINNKLYNVINYLYDQGRLSVGDIKKLETEVKHDNLDESKLIGWPFKLPGIEYNNATITLVEGKTEIRKFKLVSQPKNDVKLSFTKVDSNNRLELSATELKFTKDDWNIEKHVKFSAIDDYIANGDIDIQVNIEVTSGPQNYKNLVLTPITVKIKDNDEVGITYDDSLITLNEGQSAIRTFKLKSQPLSDVILNISSDHDDKLIISSKSLTFTSSNWNTNQSVTFTAIDDNIVGGNLDFNIKIKPSSTDTLYNNIPEKIIPITIKDNDTAGIIYDNSSVTINEGQSITRSFKLKSQPVSDVTLNISSNNSSRLIISSNKLTFNQSNWGDEHYVVFSSIDDNISNGDTTIIVTIKSTSTDTIYNNIPDGTITITVKDNDTSGIITDNSSVTITEGQSTTRSFRLQSQPTSNVILNISSSNNSKLSISKSSLTFTQSNWNIEQPVVLTAIDNNITDGDVDVSITIKSMSADSAYNNLTSGFKVTIKDNDIATPGIIIDSDLNVTITEDQIIARKFKLKSQPKSNVTLNISSNNNSRLSITPQSLTFTSSNWNTTQSVRFTAIDDNIVNGNVDAVISVKSSSADNVYNNLTYTYTITVKDNDVTSKIGTPAFSSGIFTILVVDDNDTMVWSEKTGSNSYSTKNSKIKDKWSSVYGEGYTVTQVPKSPHWKSDHKVFNYDLLYNDNLNE